MAHGASGASPPPLAEAGPYIVRRLVARLPLSADGAAPATRITCVEVLADGNLYVGTSAAEVLHFVLLPPDPNGASPEPTAIIASRLAPPANDAHGPGVQRILLLPALSKAFVLCNNTLSLYSLPELSPDSFKPISCLWVGGVDLNRPVDTATGDGLVVAIGLKKRLRLVRISEHSPPRVLRDIEYGGCLLSVRRDTFSCAADAHSYALLDVVHQQKIGLFPISSLDPQAGDVGGVAESLATVSHAPSRSISSATGLPRGQDEAHRHARGSSLNMLGFGGPPSSGRTSPHPPTQRYGFDVPEALSRDMSPAPILSPRRTPRRVDSPERPSSRTMGEIASTDKALPPPPEQGAPQTAEDAAPQAAPFVPLAPLIASPSPTEFLLTVGTTPSEPGVGMFVNLDGDMCRGSIQFSSYPDALIVDGSGIDLVASIDPSTDAEEGYVLAIVHNGEADSMTYGVEIQRWDTDAGTSEAEKEWLSVGLLQPEEHSPKTHIPVPLGMNTIVQPFDLVLPEIGTTLSTQRLQLAPLGKAEDIAKSSAGKEKADNEFAQRLSKLQVQNVLWAGDEIWWIVRNPLVIRLDSRIAQAQYTPTGDGKRIQPNRSLLEKVLGDIRGQEPRNESEYLGLIYIRQKASLMLFMDVILRTKTNIIIFENEKRITEQALIDGEIDPRVVLSLLPILGHEVVEGPEGIHISSGIIQIVEHFLQQNDPSAMSTDVNGPFGDNLLHFVKRYLQFWKRRKGMASVTSDPHLFRTIDAALLHILLLLDQGSQKGGPSAGAHRAELNDLVDKEVECFDRAVELLEQFKRLFLLSRLYQSNCKASVKAAKVLATWKRILEGEEDEGGELIDGEQRVREYLARIRDQSLVESYGAWLANRNPKLGVKVFADDQSRVKFEPTHAVALLREKAPGAVKEYLEYLVFGKKHTQYVNELITFYLDAVLSEIEDNSESRKTLSQTYETYRILQPPKPTYHSFITDNAIPAEWWQARLRLLQLLGDNQSGASSYDVPTILGRLQPYEQDLVPEMIILNGRQSRHEEALRLLTHGLGDFNTAISYCLYGYSSIFRPITAGVLPVPQSELPDRSEQSRLFGFLLQEFLRIEDLSQRVEQTGELLERFGAWLDIAHVLAMLPDEWSVKVFSVYLVNSLRRLVREKTQSGIERALSDAQNSQTSTDLVEKREKLGATFERVAS